MQYRRPYYYKYYPSGGFGTVMMITRAGERVTNYSYIIETLWYLAAGIFFFFGSRYILSKRLNLE